MELPGKLMMGNLELIEDGGRRPRSIESNTSSMAPLSRGGCDRDETDGICYYFCVVMLFILMM